MRDTTATWPTERDTDTWSSPSRAFPPPHSVPASAKMPPPPLMIASAKPPPPLAPTRSSDLARRPVSPTRTGNVRRTRSRSRTREELVHMPAEHFRTLMKCMERSEQALRAASRVGTAASFNWTTEADSIAAMRASMVDRGIFA